MKIIECLKNILKDKTNIQIIIAIITLVVAIFTLGFAFYVYNKSYFFSYKSEAVSLLSVEDYYSLQQYANKHIDKNKNESDAKYAYNLIDRRIEVLIANLFSKDETVRVNSLHHLKMIVEALFDNEDSSKKENRKNKFKERFKKHFINVCSDYNDELFRNLRTNCLSCGVYNVSTILSLIESEIKIENLDKIKKGDIIVKILKDNLKDEKFKPFRKALYDEIKDINKTPIWNNLLDVLKK